MPIFKVTTKQAKGIWKTPDGQRELFEVLFDYEGQEVSAKSWSKAVATVGWSGEVETYEKTNKQGAIETFVKQPQKEQGSYPSRSGGRSYPPKDEKAIQAMWAIGQSVQLCIANKTTDVADVYTVALELMDMVDAVKSGDEKASDEAIIVSNPPQDTVYEPSEEELAGQSSLVDDIDKAFPGTKEVNAPKENPWKKS